MQIATQEPAINIGSMKRLAKKTLQFTAETIRPLHDKQLTQIAAGAVVASSETRVSCKCFVIHE